VAYDNEMPMQERERRQVRSRRMASPRREGAVRTARVGKVRKAFWLDPALLKAARAALGAASEREAVEMALDLAAFRNELIHGAAALRGLRLARVD
jgi:hypothetical protein